MQARAPTLRRAGAESGAALAQGGEPPWEAGIDLHSHPGAAPQVAAPHAAKLRGGVPHISPPHHHVAGTCQGSLRTFLPDDVQCTPFGIQTSFLERVIIS